MKTFVRAAFLLALVAPLTASSAQGPKWRAWTGCWAITPPSDRTEPLPGQRYVCVAPTSNTDVAEIVSVADGSIISRDTVDASGRALPVNAVGCAGQRSATWSADQKRVYLKSSVVCD